LTNPLDALCARRGHRELGDSPGARNTAADRAFGPHLKPLLATSRARAATQLNINSTSTQQSIATNICLSSPLAGL
jgi:hypothetical protein